MATYYLSDFPRSKTERVKYLLNWMTMSLDLTKKTPLLSESYDLPNLSTRDLLKAFNRLMKLVTDRNEKEVTGLNIRLQQGKNANNPNEDTIAQVPDNNERLQSNNKQVRNLSTTTTLRRCTRNRKNPANTTTPTTVLKDPEDQGHTTQNLA